MARINQRINHGIFIFFFPPRKINAEKSSLDQTQVSLSAQPQLKKINKELIVAHKKNKESILVWEDYKFVFTGK